MISHRLFVVVGVLVLCVLLVAQCLGGADAAFATAERWTAGARSPAPLTAMDRVIGDMKPLERTVATSLEIASLAAWDVGASPSSVVDAMAQTVELLAPDVSTDLAHQIALLEDAVGDGAIDQLVSGLGDSISLVVLAPEADPDGWPVPRPVWILEPDDRDATQDRLEQVTRWLAGGIAPATRGLYGGAVVNQQRDGIELTTLRLNSLVAGPLPRPSFAFVGSTLLVSSTDSGVLEVAPLLNAVDDAPMVPTIEVFSFDAASFDRVLREAEPGLAPRLQRWPEAATLWRGLRTWMGLMQSLGPMSGRTVIASDGTLRVEIECRPQAISRERAPN